MVVSRLFFAKVPNYFQLFALNEAIPISALTSLYELYPMHMYVVQ